MRERTDPPPPPSASALSRADFDRVFDRYADVFWAALARHVSAAELPGRVEQLLTRFLLCWAEGLRGPELEALALALLRREIEGARGAGEGSGAGSHPLRATPPADGSGPRHSGSPGPGGSSPSSRRRWSA